MRLRIKEEILQVEEKQSSKISDHGIYVLGAQRQVSEIFTQCASKSPLPDTFCLQSHCHRLNTSHSKLVQISNCYCRFMEFAQQFLRAETPSSFCSAIQITSTMFHRFRTRSHMLAHLGLQLLFVHFLFHF